MGGAVPPKRDEALEKEMNEVDLKNGQVGEEAGLMSLQVYSGNIAHCRLDMMIMISLPFEQCFRADQLQSPMRYVVLLSPLYR